MLVETSVLAGKQSCNEKRRHFVERDFQPISASQPTVNFSVDIKNRVPLRHFADFFHVVGLRPRTVKNHHGQTGPRDKGQQRHLPAVAEDFAAASTSEEFHPDTFDNLATDFRRFTQGNGRRGSTSRTNSGPEATPTSVLPYRPKLQSSEPQFYFGFMLFGRTRRVKWDPCFRIAGLDNFIVDQVPLYVLAADISQHFAIDFNAR